jgi:hypothetical protein
LTPLRNSRLFKKTKGVVAMNGQSIELRAGDLLWAIIHVDQGGAKILELAPDLTELQVESYTGGLAPYDSNGEQLQIRQRENRIDLVDREENCRLTLDVNGDGKIIDVQHPLVTLSARLFGGGSTGHDPIKISEPLFTFRWK